MFTATRTDCKRDNKLVRLPNASSIGFCKKTAKRGDWIQFRLEPDGLLFCGRVVGRVTLTENSREFTGIECIALLGAMDAPAVRWVDPSLVTVCSDSPPRRIMEWICGNWTDPNAIAERYNQGFLSDSYLNAKENSE